MGGRDSEINAGTSSVLLEAAAWEPRSIPAHPAPAPSPHRGGLPLQPRRPPEPGAASAPSARRSCCGATPAAPSPRASSTTTRGRRRPSPSTSISATLRRISGLDLGAAETADLLRRLEFEVETGNSATLRVTDSDHRLDIEGPHDLVEEVCRIYGYDRIPSTVLSDVLPPQRGNPAQAFEDRVKDTLADLGLQEVVSYRLTTPEAEAKMTPEPGGSPPYVRLANPSTLDRVVMRRSLLASVLEAAASNSRFEDRLALFEVGRVFPVKEGDSLPVERQWAAVVLTGARRGGHWQAAADGDDRFDFFDVKGVVEALPRPARRGRRVHRAVGRRVGHGLPAGPLGRGPACRRPGTRRLAGRNPPSGRRELRPRTRRRTTRPGRRTRTRPHPRNAFRTPSRSTRCRSIPKYAKTLR